MNDQTVRAQIARLRRLQDSLLNGQPFVLPDGCVSRLDEVERRLLEAVRRDATGSTVRDGFPSGGVGDGGEDAPQSSTEASAWANLGENGPGAHDEHHVLTDAACEALERATCAVASLLTQLDSIDKLAKVQRNDPSGFCGCCGRWVEGTANDRLRSGYCHTDYTAWVRAGRPDRLAYERQRRAEAA